MVDVITIGETMLRLTPPNFKRIEQSDSVNIYIGGSESNMAVGLVRLGTQVSWLSRLTNNAVGRHIANTLRGYGVDTQHVIWTDQDRVGIYYLEEGRTPRASDVIYDRANTAISRIQPDDLPVDVFQPDNAKLLHLSGITLALSDSAYQTATHALKLAKQAGWLISFDVNYRGKLWSQDAARAGCHDFMTQADLIFIPLRDIYLIYDLPDSLSRDEAILHLHKLYPAATLLVTLGADGAAACSPSGEIQLQRSFPAEAVCRIGSGDAFVAGFLHHYLNTHNITDSLCWGTAAAAVKYTIDGDIPVWDRWQVESLVTGGEGVKGGVQR